VKLLTFLLVLALENFIMLTSVAEPMSERHPLETASWYSIVHVTWIYSLLIKGVKQPLTADDVWDLPKLERSRSLIHDFHSFRSKHPNCTLNQVKKCPVNNAGFEIVRVVTMQKYIESCLHFSCLSKYSVIPPPL
jgi:hypothetical protein